MKDKNFIIKVSDLLKQAGKKDDIHFSNIHTDNLPNLTNEGISGDVFIQSINQESVFVTLKNVVCTFEEPCDSCQENFLREVIVPQYISRFVLGEKMRDEEQPQSDDEIFVINPKDENINIENMLLQAIRFEEPVIKRCDDCQKVVDELPEDDDLDEFESKGNIVFH